VYAKYYPLWGGVTNMHLDALWKPQEGERPLDYFRAGSTGPVTPLVLAVTTVNDTVTIGISYRSTVFSTADMELLKNDFLDALNASQNLLTRKTETRRSDT
jgi:hypothetical protein